MERTTKKHPRANESVCIVIAPDSRYGFMRHPREEPMKTLAISDIVGGSAAIYPDDGTSVAFSVYANEEPQRSLAGGTRPTSKLATTSNVLANSVMTRYGFIVSTCRRGVIVVAAKGCESLDDRDIGDIERTIKSCQTSSVRDDDGMRSLVYG